MSGILSDFTSGLSKFFTKDRLLIIVGFIVLAVVLMYYTAGKVTVIDNMDTKEPLVGDAKEAVKDVVNAVTGSETKKEKLSNNEEGKEGFEGYSTQDVANPAPLLPNDANSQWASLNPVSQSNPQIPGPSIGRIPYWFRHNWTNHEKRQSTATFRPSHSKK